MSNRQVTAKDKNNNTLIFNTTTAAVADVAKGQALSATLADTPDKDTLGYDAFSTSEDYSIGDVVYHDNKIYKFTAAHPAGAWTGTDVEQTSIDEIMYGMILPTKNEVEEARGSQASLGDRLDESDTLIQGLALTKADKNGIYPQMQVGLAENLISPDGITNSEPYLYRTTAGSSSVATGIAELQKIKGDTVIWNQLMYNGDFANSGTTIAATNTSVFNQSYNSRVVADGKCTLTMLQTTQYYYQCMVTCGNAVNIPHTSGHKYYISFYALSPKDSYMKAALIKSSSGIDVSGNNRSIKANVRTRKAWILTAREFNGTVGICLVPDNLEVGDEIEFSNVIVIDLTQMFGSGNEPTTVAEFERMYPEEYYPYNEGELISVNVDKLQSVGFNAYNHSTGKAKVIGGLTPNEGQAGSYQITGAYTSLTLNGETITPNENGFFTPTKTGELVVTGGNATTTCVHLVWSGYRNGEYEPYKSNELDLEFIKSIKDSNGNTLFPEGLCSAGTVYDEITPTKAIKRVGSRPHEAGDESDATLITDGTTTNYPLATPVEVEFDESKNLTYQMDDFGTEEVVPTTGMMTAPFSANTFYMNNLRDKIRNIDGNTNAGALMNTSLTNLLATLGTAINGTFEKTWDTTNKCWTFTFTPSTPE